MLQFTAIVLNTKKLVCRDERQPDSSSTSLTKLTTSRRTLIPDVLVKCWYVYKVALTKEGFRYFGLHQVLLEAAGGYNGLTYSGEGEVLPANLSESDALFSQAPGGY